MIIEGTEVVWFKEEEFVNVHTMWAPLVWELDRARVYVGRAIGIHESNPVKDPTSLHIPNSLHYVGRAVDANVRNFPLWDFFLAASRFSFTGIGVYPYWNTPGLHLEIGEDLGQPRKYWWRDEVGNYRSINIYDLHEVFKVPFAADI
jgi:hypothetical protein